MPKVLDFDVSIYMDGVKMKEFGTEVDNSSRVPVVTCCIPSEAGKTFYVNIVPLRGPLSTHWSFRLQLDGRLIVLNDNVLVADGLASRSTQSAAQAQALQPRPPRPTPSCISLPFAGPFNPKKRKVTDSAVAVKKEVEERKRLKLAEEAQKLKAGLAAIEAEMDDNVALPVVKSEVKLETRPTFVPGEVIDLTLD
ncbi:hypothetical protein BKA70DRAFT_1558805 [Coprinopsis sp. MPI-PUGE-AT-0042]|nr:hypothetical protein BKA70DRAFT_1558805 [Coprinopsis sp. MPI-PUGE-AT-0042]